MHTLLGGEIEKHVICTRANLVQFYCNFISICETLSVEAGFCAAFTAIKFLSSTGMGGIQLSATITSCMWACLSTS